jgi:MarR family transcriptional regulator, transcriptional regulator for hemolysin
MDSDLALLLSQASYVLSTELTLALATLGITPRLFCVLRAALAGDRTQSQLAEQCALDKTTMVFTLDELERAGLAERRRSRTDRRARIIAVTPAGARMVENGVAITTRVYEDVLSSLTARERDGFVRALDRLVGEGGRLSTPVRCGPPVRRRTPRGPGGRSAVA